MIETVLAIHQLSEIVISLSALLCLIRAVRGPSVFDRALAIDALALAVVGYLLLRSYAPGERLYTESGRSKPASALRLPLPPAMPR